MGSVYRRGRIWWIKYADHGKPICESSKSETKMVANSLLKQREGEISQGKIPGVYFDRIEFDELAGDYLRDYRINNRKSLKRAVTSVNNLEAEFKGMKVKQINSSTIQTFVEKRMEVVENATINRELQALKRMLNLGAQCTPPKVDRVPHIPMLKENKPRKGFFEHADFVALLEVLPSYLNAPAEFAYKTGWRQSEVFGLEWSQVDRDQGIVCLNPGETKNDQGRTVYLDDDLKELFQKQWEARKRSGKLCRYVFPDLSGNEKIGDIAWAWRKACKAAGIPGKLWHDFRRTAVRNMVRAGIPERVAMMISGHQTRSVFERYNIVSDGDLKQASARMAAHLKAQTSRTATVLATIGPAI